MIDYKPLTEEEGRALDVLGVNLGLERFTELQTRDYLCGRSYRQPNEFEGFDPIPEGSLRSGDRTVIDKQPGGITWLTGVRKRPGSVIRVRSYDVPDVGPILVRLDIVLAVVGVCIGVALAFANYS